MSKQPSHALFDAFVARAQALGMQLAYDGQEYVITGRDGIKRYTHRWTLAMRFIEAAEQEAQARSR
jgi:hypothetical protein